jgi:hypothetical protein
MLLFKPYHTKDSKQTPKRTTGKRLDIQKIFRMGDTKE